MMDLQCSEVFPHQPTISKIPQNKAESLDSLLSPINVLVARGGNW